MVSDFVFLRTPFKKFHSQAQAGVSLVNYQRVMGQRSKECTEDGPGKHGQGRFNASCRMGHLLCQLLRGLRGPLVVMMTEQPSSHLASFAVQA